MIEELFFTQEHQAAAANLKVLKERTNQISIVIEESDFEKQKEEQNSIDRQQESGEK